MEVSAITILVFQYFVNVFFSFSVVILFYSNVMSLYEYLIVILYSTLCGRDP